MNAKKMKNWTGFALVLAVLSALCLAAVAQENGADDWHQEGQKLDSENASLWMSKGDALIRMGNYNESLKIYEKALEMADKTTQANPQDAEGWFVSGELLQRLSKNDEAIKAFDKAIAANPKYAEAWYRKGAILQIGAWGLPAKESNKNFEESLEALNKAIELNPGYGKAWSEKGYTLSALADLNKNLDKYNESVEAFDRAARLIPVDDANNLALAWGGKALALTQMGNLLKDMNRQGEAKKMYENAVLHCNRAIELDPNFTGQEARLTKAGLLSELGRYNESLAAYDEAVLSVPSDLAIFTAAIMADKGSVLIKMGKHEEALETFNGALQMDTTSAVAWKGKGDALNETGRYVEAVNAYDKAIELSPEIGLIKAYAWQGKGNALKASGRQAEAVAAFAKAKELGYKA